MTLADPASGITNAFWPRSTADNIPNGTASGVASSQSTLPLPGTYVMR
jgi:hypothetical protein